MREISWATRGRQRGSVLTPRQPAPSQNCPAGSRLKTAWTTHTIAVVPDHCSITAPSVVSVVPVALRKSSRPPSRRCHRSASPSSG
jgi:hypothetical protein